MYSSFTTSFELMRRILGPRGSHLVNDRGE